MRWNWPKASAALSGHTARTTGAWLLFLVGMLGGGIGGSTVGMWMGRRQAAQPGQATASGAAATTQPAPPARGEGTEPAKGQGEQAANPPTTPGGAASLPGRAAQAGPETQRLCVEVRDASERPVGGAAVSTRVATQWSGTSPTQAVGPGTAEAGRKGELGVFRGPLPFPEEVISGQAGGAVLGSGAAVGEQGLYASRQLTDGQGRTCLGVSGRTLILVTHGGRSTSLELELPGQGAGTGQPQAAPLVVLRLGLPVESLCQLAQGTGDGALLAEPVGEGPAPDITGRVIDERGSGVVGARIDAQIGGQRVTAFSVGRGGFVLAGLPRGGLTLRIEKAGYPPLQVTRTAGEARQGLSLALEVGGGLSGWVSDRRIGGLPTGSRLVAEGPGGGQPIALSADGSFSVPGLARGSWRLRATAPGYAPQERVVEVTARTTADGISVRDVRLALERGATLRGEVRGKAGPVVGATIEVRSVEGELLKKLLSDERGGFRAQDLPAGRVRVTGQASDGTGAVVVELLADRSEQVLLELR